MKKNVLLIYPTIIGEIPNSLAMIAGVLKEKGFNVSTAINTFKKAITPHEFVAKARECEAEIVGIAMLTFQVLEVYELIRLLKKEGLIVVLGGPHPTDAPKEVIEAGADIVVRNEGEVTMGELCDYWSGNPIQSVRMNQVNGSVPWIQKPDLGYYAGLNISPDDIVQEKGEGLAAIQGITYRNEDGKIVTNPPRKRVADAELAELPSPDFDPFDREAFRQNDSLIRGIHRIYTTRGCPATCTFCDWRVFGQRVSFEPMPKLMEEIQRRVDKYGVTNFTIADDVFTVNKKHVAGFCEAIKKIQPKVSWQASTRAEFVNLEMAEMMKAAGCYLISFGIESGDEETLQRMDKRCTVEDNYNAVRVGAQAGLQVWANLMTGFPWETPQSVANSIKFVRETWDDVYLFQVSGSLIPFPGTRIYDEYADEYGFKEYWLEPKRQGYGIQIYQNSVNPYAVSTYYQRNLFDDSYIQEESFFTYTNEFKEKVKEFVFEVGRHNLETLYPDNKWKQRLILSTANLSRVLYKSFPNLEKSIAGRIFARRAKQGKRAKAEAHRDVKRGVSAKSSAVESRAYISAKSSALGDRFGDF
tara:strand:- start:29 stop:1780 length:1752 start_codon:yes stop_codon:yes gene_type:complete